ncbi:hypothetical protein BJY01DRAFT_244802 [Aspergillus pseudoustus]|uniref:Uncharacterized protein n=1 Tax=Aspergillus pseudoustus TaxID=1810923 RepID=A0ABR4KHY8_9EURO
MFQVPSGDVGSLIICRYHGAGAASGPLSMAGGVFRRLFDPVSRGLALVMFAGTTFDGAHYQSHRQWIHNRELPGLALNSQGRIRIFMTTAYGVISVLFLPRTCSPVLLRRTASSLRLRTGPCIRHKPIVQPTALYMIFIYGITYLLFKAYPRSFTEERQWSLRVDDLPVPLALAADPHGDSRYLPPGTGVPR